MSVKGSMLGSCGVTLSNAEPGSGAGTCARLFIILFSTYLFRPSQAASIAKGFRPLWALKQLGQESDKEISYAS